MQQSIFSQGNQFIHILKINTRNRNMFVLLSWYQFLEYTYVCTIATISFQQGQSFHSHSNHLIDVTRIVYWKLIQQKGNIFVLLWLRRLQHTCTIATINVQQGQSFHSHYNHLMDVTRMASLKLTREIETCLFCYHCMIPIFSIHVLLQQSIFSKGNEPIHHIQRMACRPINKCKK